MIYQGIHNLAPTEKQQKYYLSAINNKPDNTVAGEAEKTQELTQKISRSVAFDTIINIAEKQLDISIRKKSGSQHSGK